MRTFGVIVAVLVTLALSDAYVLNDHKNYEEQLKGVFKLLEFKAAHNTTFRKLLDEHYKTYGQKPEQTKVEYNCNLRRSPVSPTSAHAVRPGDIDAIGSIGDSITAGYGITAETIIEVIINDRHLSWITGGAGSLNQGVVSVTNILRKFNPGLAGFSYDISWEDEIEAGLNVAVGGAIARDLPSQAQMLIDKMKSPAFGIDFENDWKLISVMIGGNDLCRVCQDENRHGVEAYVAGIQQAIDILYAEVPKMIVLVSNIFDITPLPAFSDGLICDLAQGVICPCAEVNIEYLKEIQREKVRRVEELINSGRYDRGRQDFTVVLQPHFDKALPPYLPGSDDVDKSYWAPDCFHPGMKAHFALATSMWNQMFEPVGQKREDLDWQIGTNLYCPTEEDPFIKTRLNSMKATEEKESDE